MQRNIPICPILQVEMVDPAITSCGHSFEKSAITEWISQRHDCCMCRTPQTLSQLTPNRELKTAIEQMNVMYDIFARMQAQNNSLQEQLKVIASVDSKVVLPTEKATDLALRTSYGKSIQKKEEELAAKLFRRAFKRKQLLKTLQGEVVAGEGKEERKEASSLTSHWHKLHAENKELKKQQLASVNNLASSIVTTMTSLKDNPSDTKLIDKTGELAAQLKQEDVIYQEKRHLVKEHHATMMTHTKSLLAKVSLHRQEQKEVKVISKQLKELREQEIKYSQAYMEKTIKQISTTSGLFGGTVTSTKKRLMRDKEEQTQLNTAFCKAVAMGNVSEAKTLLLEGAQVNSVLSQDEKMMPAIWASIQRSDEPMIDLLLAYNIDLTLCSLNAQRWGPFGFSGMTQWDLAKNQAFPSFHIATICHKPTSKILNKLIQGNVNQLNSAGNSALKFAVADCNKDAVEILLAQGATVHIEDLLAYARKMNPLKERDFNALIAPVLTLLQGHMPRPPATAPHPYA